jgi:hypothetical protein
MRAVTVVAAALGVASAACGTRFVDLSLPKDGAPFASGAGGSAGIGLPAMDAGPPVMESGLAEGACKVVPTADSRCLVCPSNTGGVTMVCLTCQPPVQVDVSGEYCRTCAWTDVMGQCLQCFSAAGTATQDDCDSLRTSAGAPS